MNIQYDRKAHLAGDPKRKGWSPAKVSCMSIYKNQSQNNRMMEKKRNDEKSDKNAKGIYVMCPSDSAIRAVSVLCLELATMRRNVQR